MGTDQEVESLLTCLRTSTYLPMRTFGALKRIDLVDPIRLVNMVPYNMVS